MLIPLPSQAKMGSSVSSFFRLKTINQPLQLYKKLREIGAKNLRGLMDKGYKEIL